LKKGPLNVLSSSPIDDEVSQINSSKITSGVIENSYEFVSKDNNLDNLYDSDDGGYAGSRKSWGSASVTDLDDSGDGIYEDLEVSIDGDLNDSRRLSSSFSPLSVPMKKTASFSDALLIKKTEELLDESRWGVEIKSIQEDEWDPSTTKLERIRAPVSAKDGKVPRKGGLSAKTLIKTTSGKRHWSSNDKSLSTLTKELNGAQAKSKQGSTAAVDVEKQFDLPLLDQKAKNTEPINRNRRMSGKGTLGEPNMNDDLELVGASLDFPREYNDITRDITRDRSSSIDYSNSDEKIAGDETNFRRINKEKIEPIIRSKDTCANYDVNNSTFDDSNNEFTRATILDEHASSITRLRCPNKAAALISSSSDGTVKLWVPGDVESRVTLDAINFMTSGDNKSTMSRTGIKVLDVWSHESCEHIWGACSDGAIRLWSGPDLKATRFLKGHDDAITTMEGIEGIGPQSSHLICTGSLDKSIRVWDGRAKKAQIFLFKGHADSVLELRWGEGGRSVVSASKDKSIRIWDTRAGRQRLVIEKHFGAVNGLRVIPEGLGRGVLRGDSLSFISSGRDSHLNLWTSSGECVGTQAAHRGSINYISDINYNLNCRSSTTNIPVIISCGGENSIKLWDIRKFRAISELSVPASSGTVTKVGWWGQSLITATNSGSIKMW
jgi:WD40 repeat protein